MPPKPDPLRPLFRIAALTEIDAYIVTEDELERLAAGSPGSQLLSISYALLPVSASFVVAILGTEIPSDPVYSTFVSVAAVTGLVGLICFGLGLSNYKSNKALLAKIKGRMPVSTPPAP